MSMLERYLEAGYLTDEEYKGYCSKDYGEQYIEDEEDEDGEDD